MNVRLKKTWGWYSGVVHKNNFLVNHYTCELSMITVSRDNEEQNLAYDRMRYFMHNIMDDSIMISHTNDRLNEYQSTGARMIVLPEEPVDQIVGMMLYLKLNAIMENRMIITDVECWSKAGESTSYLHSNGEALGCLGVDGWWSDSRPVWFDSKPRTGDSNVVNLGRAPEWKDYNLEWETAQENNNSIVFAKFNRDDRNE